MVFCISLPQSIISKVEEWTFSLGHSTKTRLRGHLNHRLKSWPVVFLSLPFCSVYKMSCDLSSPRWAAVEQYMLLQVWRHLESGKANLGRPSCFLCVAQTSGGRARRGVFACFKDGMWVKRVSPWDTRRSPCSCDLALTRPATLRATLTPGGQKVPQPAPAAQGGGTGLRTRGLCVPDYSPEMQLGDSSHPGGVCVQPGTEHSWHLGTNLPHVTKVASVIPGAVSRSIFMKGSVFLGLKDK